MYVALTVRGARVSAKNVAGPGGNWTCRLPAVAGVSSSVLTASSSNSPSRSKMWLWEAMLCGGQSNMGFAMCAVELARRLPASAGCPATTARFQVDGRWPGRSGSCKTSAGERSQSPTARWFTTNATPGTFSAVCFTAQALYESLNGTVPVGAVESCVSGTSIERWMPPASSNFSPPWLPPCARHPCQGDLWSSGMVPLLPMTFRAVLWDQGEADAKRTNASWYRTAWPAMITGWRRGLQQPGLPFVYVELDNEMHDELPHDAVDFWAAQRQAVLTLANIDFATTTDIQRGTHPSDKKDIATRLALAVRRTALGENIVSRGPELLSVMSTKRAPHSLGVGSTEGPQQQLKRVRPVVELLLRFSNSSLVSAHGIMVNTSCSGKQPPRWCGHGCGGNRADSLVMDAFTSTPLNYTLAGDGIVRVECEDENSAFRINSDGALCFLYAQKGSTGVPDGLMLPAPPVVVWCNQSSSNPLSLV